MISPIILSLMVSNKDLGIGDDMWASVSDLEHLHDTAPFFEAIRGFYVSSMKKMLVKFPCGYLLMRVSQLLHECKKATKSYVAPHSDSDTSAGPLLLPLYKL